MINNIVTVQITLAPNPNPYGMRYAVLVDRSPEFIRKFARRYATRLVFVFPFVTNAAFDYSKLSDHRVVKPLYVGNLRPRRKAIREAVRVYTTHPFSDPVACVYSEIWRCREGLRR